MFTKYVRIIDFLVTIFLEVIRLLQKKHRESLVDNGLFLIAFRVGRGVDFPTDNDIGHE